MELIISYYSLTIFAPYLKQRIEKVKLDRNRVERNSRVNYEMVPLLLLIVICVFGGLGERVRAADGFVFACADIRLHATVGVGSLDLRDALCFVTQRRILRFLESG